VFSTNDNVLSPTGYTLQGPSPVKGGTASVSWKDLSGFSANDLPPAVGGGQAFETEKKKRLNQAIAAIRGYRYVEVMLISEEELQKTRIYDSVGAAGQEIHLSKDITIKTSGAKVKTEKFVGCYDFKLFDSGLRKYADLHITAFRESPNPDAGQAARDSVLKTWSTICQYKVPSTTKVYVLKHFMMENLSGQPMMFYHTFFNREFGRWLPYLQGNQIPACGHQGVARTQQEEEAR